MKICIIGHTERNYLPYMERYITFFEENKVDYDIICWQREETGLVAKKNEFNFYEEPKGGIFNKATAYLRFKEFVINVLEKNNYDKVVILSTVPAVVLSKYLFKHFDGKYLFDFRDYSFERFLPYKKLVDKLIDRSQLTTISSRGFLDFLEENEKIVVNHNIPFVDAESTMVDLKNKQVFNIGFIGGVRYYDENVALINSLKNTFRYQIWYIGQPAKGCDLQSYCAQNEITNVSFIGKYNNAQKQEYYKCIDIINSIYGSDSLEVTTALPNRLYEACIYKKPIISSKKTYLGELIHNYNLGVVIDVEKDDVLTIINDYINNFDVTKFEDGCKGLLAEVANDEAILHKKLKQFIIPVKKKK